MVKAQQETAAAPARAVIVLTSARSGSSVVTHALQVLGVDLGDRLRSGARKNPKGFFEDLDILALSRRLRDALVEGRRLALVPEERWADPAVLALEDEAVALLKDRFGTRRLWGFKNGRTLRFLPFWERVFERLGVDVHYVIALRNPLASARSRTRARRAKLFDYDAGIEVNQFQWLIEVAPYFERLRDKPFLVVEFDRLVGQPGTELERLRRKLHLPHDASRQTATAAFVDHFLERRLIHHRSDTRKTTTGGSIHPMVRDAYQWLHALAIDEVTSDQPALWQDWALIGEELEALRPLLQALENAELALRRTRLNPLSPLGVLGQALSNR